MPLTSRLCNNGRGVAFITARTRDILMITLRDRVEASLEVNTLHHVVCAPETYETFVDRIEREYRLIYNSNKGDIDVEGDFHAASRFK